MNMLSESFDIGSFLSLAGEREGSHGDGVHADSPSVESLSSDAGRADMISVFFLVAACSWITSR
jgi:hypothetical protein